MKTVLFFLLICLLNIRTNAQQTKPTQLRVFYDCSDFNDDCQYDYIRQEANMLTFVRDRMDCDVHMQLKSNYNSIGVSTFTYFMIGKNKYASLQDTINFVIPMNSTSAETRKLLVANLQTALLPYLAKTTLLDNISPLLKTQTTDSSQKKAEEKKDPYNYWVYQIGGNANTNGSKNYAENYLSGYANADKETEKTKTNISGYASNQYSKYINTNGTYEYNYQNYYMGFEHAKKISEHWAAGLVAEYNNSLFSNLKYQFSLGPKVEYSIFPYKQFNTNRWVVGYNMQGRHNTYYDTTIYFKMKETFMTQSLSSVYSTTKDWGSVNLGVFWRNMLNDFNKNSLSFTGSISARLTKGLNVNFWGNYNFVRNQINISKDGATVEELLVRNKELLSNYNYSAGFGVSYRFGSNNNSIVNPIFKGMSY